MLLSCLKENIFFLIKFKPRTNEIKIKMKKKLEFVFTIETNILLLKCR